MRIFYHNDDDGRCAAAIIKRELISVFEDMSKSRFHEYSHNKGIDYKSIDFFNSETIYIVDIALDKTILELIKYCIKNFNTRVIHIDHHKSGIEFYEEHKEELNNDKYRHFFRDGVSGCMLTWVYISMNSDERLNPENVPFDFSEGFTHVAFYPESEEDVREYYIPESIRYIDDNDVWRHSLDNTIEFCDGFKLVKEKHPLDKTWDDLIYNDKMMVFNIIKEGRTIGKFLESMYASVMHNSHVALLNGKRVLCLNMMYGNARIFGDKINEYDAVCKYSYDGDNWVYTMYSKEDGGADCSVLVKALCERYRGVSAGGHEHAAGMCLCINIFSD